MAFFPFKRKPPPEGHPPPIEGTGFAVETGKAPYVSAHYGGLDGTASPSVLNQQPETGLKEFGPPPEGAPDDYYKRRNSWRIDNFRHEPQSQPQRLQVVTRTHPADDPKREPPPPDRLTAYHSPSGTQFYVDRPYGLRHALHLNGNHFSMATMQRAYPIAGMSPAKRFRSTFRLEPPARDDYIPEDKPPVNRQPDMDYTSPAIIPSFRAFRLGG